MADADAIRQAYEAACMAEIDALKPGNVHRFAAGHRMTVDDFLLSARASAPALVDPGRSPGRRILAAVQATRRAVGTNTNLGIVLLCAPLARAAELDATNLREAVERVLASLDIHDTRAIFQAIVLASPGGLGSSDSHDVREEPQVTIVEAMRAAADRDTIARQYVTGFQDVFDIGVAALDRAALRQEAGMWPTVFAYLSFLSAIPDSHVARKHGTEIAERVTVEAEAIFQQVRHAQDEPGRMAILLDFDRSLKARGINPGTSADLTVAAILAQRLRDGVRDMADPAPHRRD